MQCAIDREDLPELIGPFDSADVADDVLKKAGFRRVAEGDERWIRDSSVFAEVVLARVRPLRLPDNKEN